MSNLSGRLRRVETAINRRIGAAPPYSEAAWKPFLKENRPGLDQLLKPPEKDTNKAMGPPVPPSSWPWIPAPKPEFKGPAAGSTPQVNALA